MAARASRDARPIARPERSFSGGTPRPCTCPPEDGPPRPCSGLYALADCHARYEAEAKAARRARVVWGSILHERHQCGCTCSYCGGLGPGFGILIRYGLNIPRAWRSPTAWWVIKYAPRRYLRWTWPRFVRRAAA